MAPCWHADCLSPHPRLADRPFGSHDYNVSHVRVRNPAGVSGDTGVGSGCPTKPAGTDHSNLQGDLTSQQFTEPIEE
jgi:hypothetical protein